MFYLLNLMCCLRFEHTLEKDSVQEHPVKKKSKLFSVLSSSNDEGNRNQPAELFSAELDRWFNLNAMSVEESMSRQDVLIWFKASSNLFPTV